MLFLLLFMNFVVVVYICLSEIELHIVQKVYMPDMIYSRPILHKIIKNKNYSKANIFAFSESFPFSYIPPFC